MKYYITSITAFFSIICLAFIVAAQKLPKTQTQSVLLPAIFKIDGNATEWGNKFQCFSKNVNLYCTIANDNEHLYLAIQATDPVIVKKVIAGGVRFTVCKSGSRGEAHPFVVTFPTIEATYQPGLYNDVNSFKKNNKKDSLIKAINKNLLRAIKLIKLDGGSTTADSISVYNDIGVKTGIHIDENLHLTCEILLPLKLTGIKSLKSPIAYNIMLVGGSETNKSVRVGNVIVTDIPMSMVGMGDNNSFQTLNSPTDFWGTCTLAQ